MVKKYEFKRDDLVRYTSRNGEKVYVVIAYIVGTDVWLPTGSCISDGLNRITLVCKAENREDN